MSSILKQARLALGLTQAEVARELGVKNNSISRWENNPQKLPFKRRKMLAGILQISESDIPLRPPSHRTHKPKPDDGVLRRARMNLGLSLQQVATKIGRTSSSLWKWEKGICNPPPEKRAALARLLQVDENDIPAQVLYGVIKPKDGVLRRARIMLGLTQQQVATELGVTQPTIEQWERRSPNFSQEQRASLAYFLRLDESDIPVRTNPRKKTKSSNGSLRRVQPGLGLIQTYKISKPKPDDGVLLRARIVLGLTIQQVANEIGVTKSSIHHWEKELPNPPQEQRGALARLLQINEEDIPARARHHRAINPKDGVLRQARIVLGLTLQRVATEIGVSKSSIAKWEKESPPQKYRGALACLFQIDEDDIPVRIEPQRVLNSKPSDGVLRRARITLGLSQDQAAAKFGVSQTTIASWETRLPPQEKRSALASLFHIEEDDIPVKIQPQRALHSQTSDGILRRARIALGWSQEKIANKLGVSKSSISNWEKGASCPSLKRRPALARLLGLEESEVLVRTQPHRVSKPKPSDGLLRRSRIAQGLTQKQIAAKIGVAPTSIRKWENDAIPQKYRGVLANLLGLEESDIPVRESNRISADDCGVLEGARLALGLSQKQVADKLGVGADRIYLWEKGSCCPSLKRRDALAQLLELKESEIPVGTQLHKISKPKSTDGVLRRARLKLGLTQRQIAAKIGASTQSIGNWERGLYRLPQKERTMLAHLLDIKESDIPVQGPSHGFFKPNDGTLQGARLALGLTQRQVAIKLGVTTRAFSRWEKESPPQEQISALANLLHLKESDISDQIQSLRLKKIKPNDGVLRRARLMLGLSQQQVAVKLGVSKSSIHKWEKGSPHPSPEQRNALANLLHVKELDIPVQIEAHKVTEHHHGALWRARTALGLTMQQIATILGVAKSTINRWEKGSPHPSPEQRTVLANLFHLDESEIPVQIDLRRVLKPTDGVLRKARLALGLTQKQIAIKLGLTKSTIANWEKGSPPQKQRISLARLLQINENSIPVRTQSRSYIKPSDRLLRRKRIVLGLTQKQVALKLGVTQSHVSKWEKNAPPEEQRAKLARLLYLKKSDIPVQKRPIKSSKYHKLKPQIGDRILQRARMALGWGIQQVARRLRVSSSKVERWENESPHPPLKYRAALAQLFDLDESDILVQEKNTPVAKPVQATKPTQRSLPSSFSEGNNAKQNDTADSTQGVLLRARLALGLNRTQVAHRVGVSHSSIYAWEMEQRRPSPKYKEALAQVLNLDVDKILATAEDPEERDEKQRLARLLEMKEQSRILAISLQGMPKLTKGYVMLLQARKGLRLTIAKVAQVLKVSVTTVWCWENGLEPVPESHRKSLTRLLKFSKEEAFLLWG